ncbi:hypothetical protein D3C80_1116860 [compost metagenome]
MVDDAALEREEIGPFRRCVRQRAAGRRQGQRAVGKDGARLDSGRPGGDGDHVLHQLAEAWVQRRGAVAHRQVQRQVQILGHAHLVAANVEVGGDTQGQGLAGAGRGRDLDRHGQEDRVRVAVVHQALQTLTFRQGPQDVAGRDPSGQRPGQGGGAARVALVAPIGVPARLDLLTNGDDRRRARRGPGAHRDQFGLDSLGALWSCGGGDGAGLQRLIQGRRRGGRRGGEGQPDEKGGEKTQGHGTVRRERGVTLDAARLHSHHPETV